jgi:hypothetical protein
MVYGSDSFSYYLVQKPLSPLNVGIPLAALSPAPVKIMMFLEFFRYLAASLAFVFIGFLEKVVLLLI